MSIATQTRTRSYTKTAVLVALLGLGLAAAAALFNHQNTLDPIRISTQIDTESPYYQDWYLAAEITTTESSTGDFYPDIAVDSTGVSHICTAFGSLRHYIPSNGTNEEIDPLGAAGVNSGCNIVLDSSDQVHISACSANALYYYYQLAGVWTEEVIDNTIDCSPSTLGYSMTVDSAGNVYQSYYDDTNADLSVAKRDASTSSWTTTDVDTSVNDTGFKNTIALDSTDHVYLAYNDTTNGVIKFSSFDGTNWTTSTVADGEWPTMTIDHSDRIHILYVDGAEVIHSYSDDASTWQTETVENADGGAEMEVAVDEFNQLFLLDVDNTDNTDDRGAALSSPFISTNAGGAWTVGSIAASTNGVQYSNGLGLAIDATGKLHIAYLTQYDDQHIEYLNNVYGDTKIVGGANIGQYNDIALDTNNLPYLATYNSSTGGNVVWDWTGSTWEMETVDTGSNNGLYNSIAISSSGIVSLSYYDANNGDLKLATRSRAGNWTKESVDTTNDTGLYTALALDSSSRPHISYYNATTADLYYAYKQRSGSWSKQFVDGVEADMGKYSSIAIGSDGRVHICYYDDTHNQLKHARNTGSGWTRTVVDTASGSHCSIAVNSANDTDIISYYDSTNRQLKLASVSYGASTTVTTETVDATTDTGTFTSVAYDSDENIVISYYDAGNGDLKYALKEDAVWTTRTLDIDHASTDAGQYTALAIDDFDHAHIAHSDVTNGYLLYTYY